jgi:hypothetical protein
MVSVEDMGIHPAAWALCNMMVWHRHVGRHTPDFEQLVAAASSGSTSWQAYNRFVETQIPDASSPLYVMPSPLQVPIKMEH